MRFSIALLTVVASALAVFASPAAETSEGAIYKRGGPEICTANLDGSGETDEQVTKDCCAAVNQQAYFNEAEKECQPYGGHFGNSVDTGAMVQCCSSRGRGSKAV
ncbi:uncharacterized protein STEHIDRAFT_124761 [Stereum hirsutum FP-91666 SS1]|uniref:uncharacterized protein n=1 Tax=Stereum hirsutum (strain FP-91666) TaxID=721885 RepID=UPI000444967A|nr:uncharacterized protein STEHIDRAFT_124761 [Stereum hirsutum FP-91666 SS1]EIM81889.1 hypothetical protein STEHIDRAFT_124761 [Stereum hirsutum FP-91666 SS1]